MLNIETPTLSIKKIIYHEIACILSERNILNENLSSEMTLNAELGISSLEFARLVSLLEDKLKMDPFMENVPITSVRTIGDLITAYQSELEKN